MGLEDKMDQAKGRAEQAAGDLTDDEELKARGKGHETEGKAKGAVDAAADKVRDTIDSASDKMNDKR